MSNLTLCTQSSCPCCCVVLLVTLQCHLPPGHGRHALHLIMISSPNAHDSIRPLQNMFSNPGHKSNAACPIIHTRISVIQANLRANSPKARRYQRMTHDYNRANVRSQKPHSCDWTEPQAKRTWELYRS